MVKISKKACKDMKGRRMTGLCFVPLSKPRPKPVKVVRRKRRKPMKVPKFLKVSEYKWLKKKKINWLKVGVLGFAAILALVLLFINFGLALVIALMAAAGYFIWEK